MIITTKTYNTDEEILSAARIALSNRLFVPTWCLRDVLWDIVEGNCNDVISIVLAFHEDKPIGIAYAFEVFRYEVIEAWYFVRKRYRRNGIGTMLHKEIEKIVPDEYELKGAPTTKGAEKFFQSLGYIKNEYCDWRK